MRQQVAMTVDMLPSKAQGTTCKNKIPHLEGRARGCQDGHDGLLGGAAGLVLLGAALACHYHYAPRQRLPALCQHLLPARATPAQIKFDEAALEQIDTTLQKCVPCRTSKSRSAQEGICRQQQRQPSMRMSQTQVTLPQSGCVLVSAWDTRQLAYCRSASQVKRLSTATPVVSVCRHSSR